MEQGCAPPKHEADAASLGDGARRCCGETGPASAKRRTKTPQSQELSCEAAGTSATGTARPAAAAAAAVGRRRHRVVVLEDEWTAGGPRPRSRAADQQGPVRATRAGDVGVVVHGAQHQLRGAQPQGLGRVHQLLHVVLIGQPEHCLCAYQRDAALDVRAVLAGKVLEDRKNVMHSSLSQWPS
ncbi:unnamed protein product [Prorocentrum cordatum]|uniref:Uncharacterized protein n=1 Tax=Prorocentrum cordatum TaxID=2364126 RepID=A0ABN9TBE6_9DINO|nr:unnamed protein product [Polarella glacialis]